jgi:hypothetical protein
LIKEEEHIKVNPLKSPLTSIIKREKDEFSRSRYMSHLSAREQYPEERKISVLEHALSVLGDISSRGVGGGVATKLASPILARREQAELKMSIKS